MPDREWDVQYSGEDGYVYQPSHGDFLSTI